jgi:hypothetical protein
VKRGALAAVLLLGACSNEASKTAAPPKPRPVEVAATPTGEVTYADVDAPLTVQGWGPIETGMSQSDAMKMLGPTDIDDAQSAGCNMLHPKNGFPDFYVMTEDGVVTRVTIWGRSKFKTDKGLGIGSTAAEVRAAYGPALEVGPAPYEEAPAHSLVAWTIKDKAGVRYETDGHRRVTAIHVGGHSILYDEDCL